MLENLDSKDFSAPHAVYLHIPFCRRRCFYCDFPITVLGDRTSATTSPMVADYLDALAQEITRTAEVLGIDRTIHPPLESIFFGGGTPSLLAPEQIERLIRHLSKVYSFTETIEISMEIDPGTFTLSQIQGWKTAGVNRFSLGIQSTHDALLEVTGRSHRHADNLQAIDFLHQADITNFSLDLISGLPGLTAEQWQQSLDWALATQAAHLSVYDLTLEAGTVFGKRHDRGQLQLPEEDSTAQMYRQASQTLRSAGYAHYEISNYAKPNYQCRHNRTYWESRPFYGFGMGATSAIQGDRIARPRTRAEYYHWLEHQLKADLTQPSTSQSKIDRLLETLMMGLRLQEGLAIAPLVECYGSEIIDRVLKTLQRYEKSGWVLWSRDRIQLSEPEGFLFSNVVLVALFEELEV